MYFLFYNLEDGAKCRKFNSSNDVIKYIKEYFSYEDHGSQIIFDKHFPDDLEELYCDTFVLIKGDVIVPKIIKTVTEYEIE